MDECQPLLHGSAGIAQPHVRKVVRKGYRDKQTGGWIAYSFVGFRDVEEAALVELSLSFTNELIK